jgi:hypothetical protein
MIKAFIQNHRLIITAILSVLATLATLTATSLDDRIVADAQSFVDDVAAQEVSSTVVVSE